MEKELDFSSLTGKEKELLAVAYNGLISMMILHEASENHTLALDVLANAVEGIIRLSSPKEAIALNTKLMHLLQASGNKDYVFGEIDPTKANTTTFKDVAEVAQLDSIHKL